MTLAAIWCNYEIPEAPVLWMASDSRISAEEGRLIDSAGLIFFRCFCVLLSRRRDMALWYSEKAAR